MHKVHAHSCACTHVHTHTQSQRQTHIHTSLINTTSAAIYYLPEYIIITSNSLATKWGVELTGPVPPNPACCRCGQKIPGGGGAARAAVTVSPDALALEAVWRSYVTPRVTPLYEAPCDASMWRARPRVFRPLGRVPPTQSTMAPGGPNHCPRKTSQTTSHQSYDR